MWFLDTRATHHMTYALEYFTTITYLDTPLQVCLSDDSIQKTYGYGDVVIQLPHGRQITITDVYYVPGLTKSLISINELTSRGMIVAFMSTGCRIISHTLQAKQFCITCPKQGNLYPLGRTRYPTFPVEPNFPPTPFSLHSPPYSSPHLFPSHPSPLKSPSNFPFFSQAFTVPTPQVSSSFPCMPKFKSNLYHSLGHTIAQFFCTLSLLAHNGAHKTTKSAPFLTPFGCS